MSKLPFILYKLWKTSAIGSHNLFWIKTYKLEFLCKIVVDTYHEWENIFQLWERFDQRCQRVHHKFTMHTKILFFLKDSLFLYNQITLFLIILNKILSKREGMYVFGVQFLWEVIGSNFSTSESAMTPKLPERRFFRSIWFC